MMNPSTGLPATGVFKIILGSVHCSFRQEIPAFAGYELWSSILSWDRKWLYIVTHFVPAGTTRPTEWLDPRQGRRRVRSAAPGAATNSKSKIYASALSKYVFKLGRLTVHPATVLGASGLLPQRPGGWEGGEGGVGPSVHDAELRQGGDCDWEMVERKRTDGLQMAEHFLALDGLQELFDGGSKGALGIFGPG